MLELFSPIRPLLHEEHIRIDNIVFRLHSRATVILFFACATLVTAKQYVGEPITCISDRAIDRTTLNAYCWIYSTFTVARHLKGIPGRSVASPGVGSALEDDELHYHRYYQWVCFILGLQAILFYVPRALWGIWERDTIALLARDLSSSFDREAWTEDRKRQLVDYFIDSDVRTNNFYAIRFVICEILNFLNSIGQLYLLDFIFAGEFGRYGVAVIEYIKDEWSSYEEDPMTKLFPKVTKCTMHTIGSSGSVQIHDALCVLSLNVMNEKIFFLLWFWLILLAIIGFFALLYRIIVFSQPRVRVYLLRASTRALAHAKANTIVRVLTFGDWFLLHRLAQNVSPIIYRELLDELAASLSTKPLTGLV